MPHPIWITEIVRGSPKQIAFAASIQAAMRSPTVLSILEAIDGTRAAGQNEVADRYEATIMQWAAGSRFWIDAKTGAPNLNQALRGAELAALGEPSAHRNCHPCACRF